MDTFKKQLLLFGGKGGTGKTTVAAATALKAAEQGKKVLIFSTDPVLSLSDSFGQKIGNKITEVTKNVYALEIDAEALLEKFREENGDVFKQIINEGTYLDDEDITKFAKLSLPGLDEVMALIRVMDFLDEAEYDMYILDTAPTGHTMRLLTLPSLMSRWVDVLLEMHGKKRLLMKAFTGKIVDDRADKFLKKIRQDIKRVRSALTNPQKTQFTVITIPEAMSVYETKRFMQMLKHNSIPVSSIIINRVLPVNTCGYCTARREQQQAYVKELREAFPDYGIKEMPLFYHEIKGVNDLLMFSKVLYYQNYEVPSAKRVGFEIFSRERQALFDVLKNNDLKLLLFGGKGGTGKTTVAAATALRAAEQGKKVLIFSTDPAHSLSDSFGCSIGDRITRVAEGVDALEMDAEKLFEDLRERYKKEIRAFFEGTLRSEKGIGLRLSVDEKIIADLFDLSPPGVDELMALKKLIDFIESKEHDLYILDTAPTGHTLRLLALPDTAIEWAKVLIQIKKKYPIIGDVGESLQTMLDAVKKAKDVLTDPVKTQFVTVTIPEALSVYQTERLINNLDKLKISSEHVIINQVIPKNKCGLCLSQRKQQLGYVKEIGKKLSKHKITEMPLFPHEIRGLKDLEEFSKALFRK
ncbi:MAG: ArsA family ATPase [Nanoarchaeota archaeon]|nr:ArsA family ATPase [Nanoarchaeota archaeon]